MSQIAGRKLPQTKIPAGQYSFASVEQTDHHGNAGLHTMVFGNGLKSHTITAGNYLYIGEAAPGSDESSAVWRVTRIEDVNGDGSEVITTHAYIPAQVYKGSYANEAAINAAYPTGEPGWNVFNEDTGTFWVWNHVSGSWADTSSSTKIPDTDARYSGFDHAFSNYATLLYA